MEVRQQFKGLFKVKSISKILLPAKISEKMFLYVFMTEVLVCFRYVLLYHFVFFVS